MKIDNAQVLITGANRGIGLALAKMFAMERSHLHLVVRIPDENLAQELTKLGARSVKMWQADFTKREQVAKLVDNLQGESLDILVNNAGQLTGGLLEEQDLDEIYNMFQVNLLSLVQFTQGVLPGMIKRGKGLIVNNSSVSALMHFPCASTYAASKAALWAFNNCLARELNGTGVNTLCLVTPGIKTRMFDEIEKKYSKNLEIPEDYITPEIYAQKIKRAIIQDKKMLWPSGLTAVGLKIAKYLPSAFDFGIRHKFSRQVRN